MTYRVYITVSRSQGEKDVSLSHSRPTETTMAAKPTLVLVHGAWHRPEHFSPLVNILHDLHGYKCVTVSLPSMEYTPETGHKGLAEDTSAIRKTILAELSTNPSTDVVLVAHSYGGIPAMNSLQDLDKSARSKAGHQNCVSAAALICAFVLTIGPTLLDIVNASSLTAPIFDLVGNGCNIPNNPKHNFYHELPQAESEHWISLLRPQSLVANVSPVTCEGFREVPTSYLVCTEDRAIPIDAQRAMLEALKPTELRTEEIASAHSPFLSVPERAAEFVRRSAGEKI